MVQYLCSINYQANIVQFAFVIINNNDLEWKKIADVTVGNSKDFDISKYKAIMIVIHQQLTDNYVQTYTIYENIDNLQITRNIRPSYYLSSTDNGCCHLVISNYRFYFDSCYYNGNKTDDHTDIAHLYVR